MLNVVNGDKEAVDALLDHPDVAGGQLRRLDADRASTSIARGTAHGKRVQALGGAKNHMVVMPDADLDQAADALMGAAYGSAGERCMAISVAVAVGDDRRHADRAAGAARARAEGRARHRSAKPRWGRWSPGQHLDKVKGYVDLGVKEGAKLVVDGRGLKLQGYENGYFLGGCLFDHVTPEMRIYKEEIFGPVLSVVRVPDFDDGGQAGQRPRVRQRHRHLHPRRRRRARLRQQRSRSAWSASTCRSRCRWPITASAAGSARSSATTHMHGPEGVRFYTKLKTVTARWPTGIRAGAEFVMPTMR